MTFSIVAADPETNEIGVATESKFLAVGAVVPWARAEVGGVATQAVCEVTFGPRGLELLASGMDPQAALDSLLDGDPGRAGRQVGIVDAVGRSASFTGPDCFEHATSLTGPGYACQGNILASARVVPAMADAFEGSSGPLADRLVATLRAAQREGGDRRGQESAALLVVKPGGGYGGTHDRYIDLRVDHHDEPIEELAGHLALHRLYFDRPREEDVIVADAALASEIAGLLEKLGVLPAGRDMWDALSDYMGWENLEERWAGRDRIDPTVLEYLQRKAAEAGGSG
jgi:uncharacterized Ntn-hydrolase superfamily protein